ncbi:MAG: GAF domain-containing protein, partial [Acidobacteria bacterium]|nr:GAF domain-containing protein [Acidobacteriota bacterium]
VRINEELQEREEEIAQSNLWLKGLYRIAKVLNQATSEQEVAEKALERAMELPGIQGGWISLKEGGSGFRIASVDGLPPALQTPGAFEGDCLCRRKLLSGELTQVINIIECERLQKAKGDTRGVRLHASIPLWIGDETLGIMNLIGPQQGGVSDQHIMILNGVGNQIGIALERARLHERLERMVEERTAALTAEIAVRKEVEAALRQSEARKGAVLEGALDAIITMDPEGKITEFNPAAEQMFGYARAQVLGKAMAELIIPPHLRDRHHRGLANYLATGEERVLGRRVEMPAMRADGTEFPVELAITRIRLEGPPMFTGYVRDITERKQAEATRQALYKASLQIQEPLALRERLDRLLEAAHEILQLDRVNILLSDPEERWLQAVACLGVEEPVESIRIPIGPAGGALAQAFRTQEAVIWDGRNPVPAPLRLQPPFDQIKALRSRAFVSVPLVVQGRSIGVLGADRRRSRRPLDAATREMLQLFVTQAALAIEQARLYEAQRMAAIQLEARVEDRTRDLQEAMLLLEAVSRHKSEFLANMSHELRTPLNSILGFSDLLRDQKVGPMTEKQARYIHNIRESGRHLLTLINDLLDLSKVEAGKLELRPEVFNLREALEAAMTEIRPQSLAKDLGLTLQVDESLSLFTADPVRFRQILLNLLSNAIKFTPTGGSVTVTAKRVRSAECEVRSETDSTSHLAPRTLDVAEFVEIAVADTGVGMKPEDLPKLFQPFSQLEGSFTREQHGTGLGLALTRRLVESHGGTVWAASEGENRGSTFTVRLPLA